MTLGKFQLLFLEDESKEKMEERFFFQIMADTTGFIFELLTPTGWRECIVLIAIVQARSTSLTLLRLPWNKHHCKWVLY